MIKFFRIIFLSLISGLFYSPVLGEKLLIPTGDSISLDQSTRYGKLPNGLTYFIKSTDTTDSKLYLDFYVKAGYNQQDKDQLNIAHAVEHLAFRATENFPSGILSSEQFNNQKLGPFKLGASSGSLVTSYNMVLQSNSKVAFETILTWFEDIATNLSLTESDIDLVRRELRQEFLNSTQDDLNNYYAKAKLDARLYPCRLDYSGLLQHLETFKPEVLKRYYKDWYRPEFMAINVIGNIPNLDETERMIMEKFSMISPSSSYRNPVDCNAIFFANPPQYVVVERPDDSTRILQNKEVTFRLMYRDSMMNFPLNSKEGIEKLFMFQILNELLNQRFKEVTSGYNPFSIISVDTYTYREMAPALEIVIRTENHPLESLQESLYAIHQLQKFGFSKTEWDGIKQKKENLFKTLREDDPEYWVKEFKNFFIRGEALPDNKIQFFQEWLSNISLKEFNNFTSKFFLDLPKDIGIIAPSGHLVLSYKENDIRAVLGTVYSQKVEPFKTLKVPMKLMDDNQVKDLKRKKSVEKRIGESGAREFILQNGLKLVLYPFKPGPGIFRNDLKIHGFSLKGAKCFAKQDWFSAFNAPSIVMNSGINGMDKFMVNRILSNNDISTGSVFPYIDLEEIGIQAEVASEKLEIMLQFIYLYFTSPNYSEEAYKDWKFSVKKNYQHPSSNIVTVDFNNAVRALTDDNYLSQVLNKRYFNGIQKFESIEKTDLEKAIEINKQLYNGAKDFTFVISGDFEIDSVLPLFQKYIGNLPNSEEGECSIDSNNNKSIQKGPLFVQVPIPEKLVLENVLYDFRFIENTENLKNWKEQINIEALAAITDREIKGLRFKKNYSLYSLGAQVEFKKEMGRYLINSVLECMPQEFPMIRNEVHQIIKNIKLGFIEKDIFQKGITTLQRKYDVNMAYQHNTISKKLYEHYRFGQPWINPLEIESYVRSLTIEDVVATANKFFKDENFYEFVLNTDN